MSWAWPSGTDTAGTLRPTCPLLDSKDSGGYCVLSTAAGESTAPSMLCGVTAWLPRLLLLPIRRPPVTAIVRPMQTAIGGMPLTLDQKFLSSSFVTASLA